MTNEELKNKFDQTLKPLGYKKKGNKWFSTNEHLTKIIELQKYSYSNLYYINYGVTFNQLDYKDVVFHIFNRHENTLDLEITRDQKSKKLIHESLTEITETLAQLTTVEDVINYTRTLPTLNILPVKVKEFLNFK